MMLVKETIIKEAMSFERGRDPKASMGLGDPRLQKIKSNYKYLEPIVDTLTPGDDDEFSFRDFRTKIDSLKGVAEYIIMNHMRKKYNIEISFDFERDWSQSTASNQFAVANIGDYIYEFRRNGVENMYWIKVISKKGELIGKRLTKKNIITGNTYSDDDWVETSQSSSLRIFDQKFQQLYKKYH